MKFLCMFITLMVICVAPRVLAQRLILTNPLDVDRPPQVVEIPLEQVLNRLHVSLAQANSIVAESTGTGERIPDQIYISDSASAPSLLLLVRLPAHGKAGDRLPGRSRCSHAEGLVFGREAPERKDDFAWENELVAYRVYGPALQATGEITSGIDVWSKRVPNFVIDSFYKRDLEGIRVHNPALSYHKDNGQGLDSYYVGPSRACGGTAVFSGGKLLVSKNYTNMQILGNGPIRFAFEVSYAPWDANGISVSETKRITLDAGTHLNRIESTYTFEGTRTLDLAAGIAVHENAGVEFSINGSIASVWDTPQDPSAGRIATGLLAEPSQRARTLEAAGHALMIFRRHSGESFTYFAGSGWSKADMPTAAAWNDYLKLRLRMLRHPITIRWVKQGRFS
jgi:hypothetical protein